MNKLIVQCIVLLTTLVISYPSFAIDNQKESLDLIRNFAKEMCTTVPLESNKSEMKLKGDAQAKLSGVIRKLTDLGASGAVDYSSHKSQGVLQNDMAKALSDANSCRLHIFDTLEKKLLHGASTPPPKKNYKRPPPKPKLVAANLSGEIYFSSEDGDYIGDGKNIKFSSENAKFSATTNGQNISIEIRGDDSWSIELAAPEGQILKIGSYELAQRAAFHNPVKPGLDVSGAGRGCNTLSGSFKIHELKFNNNMTLQSLRADFEQHCDEKSATLKGSISLKGIV